MAGTWPWINKATAIEALAFLADDEQQRERAVRLLGASQAWHSKCQSTHLPEERQEREARVAALRAALGDEAFATAWASVSKPSSARKSSKLLPIYCLFIVHLATLIIAPWLISDRPPIRISAIRAQVRYPIWPCRMQLEVAWKHSLP